MMDRGAAQAKAPQLDLSFRCGGDRCTYIDRRVFRWPYTLSRGFHLDQVPAGMMTLILQTVSGAVQANDSLLQHIHVGAHAAAHITTQGATAVHRADRGSMAVDEVALHVEPDGHVEYMPGPRILFPSSGLSQSVALWLDSTASAIVSDGFVVHDPAAAGRGFRWYASEIAVRRPDGRLLAVDRIELDSMLHNSGRRARYAAYGTLIVAVERPDGWLAELGEDIEARIRNLADSYAAVSALPNKAGLSLRVAAVDGQELRANLHAGWSAARRHLFGSEPDRRRF